MEKKIVVLISIILLSIGKYSYSQHGTVDMYIEVADTIPCYHYDDGSCFTVENKFYFRYLRNDSIITLDSLPSNISVKRNFQEIASEVKIQSEILEQRNTEHYERYGQRLFVAMSPNLYFRNIYLIKRQPDSTYTRRKIYFIMSSH